MAKLICHYAPSVNAYCGSLYTCPFWCNYTVKQYREIQVAYNYVLDD